jgi:hypothetical protein
MMTPEEYLKKSIFILINIEVIKEDGYEEKLRNFNYIINGNLIICMWK